MQPRPLFKSTLSNDQVQVLFPVVHDVVPQQDLAEPWAVHLDFGIPVIAFNGGQPAEDHRAVAAFDYRRAHLGASGVHGQRFR